MPANSGWERTPRESIELECARRGTRQVAAGCIALLAGREVDDGLLVALAGPASGVVLNDGPKQRNQYWRRVWGARGLLYAWDEQAEDAIVGALADEHWRVREMAAKVIARHQVDDGLDAVTGLRADQVARVRSAADRAVARLTVSGP
jgi:hypothetical protein